MNKKIILKELHCTCINKRSVSWLIRIILVVVQLIVITRKWFGFQTITKQIQCSIHTVPKSKWFLKLILLWKRACGAFVPGTIKDRKSVCYARKKSFCFRTESSSFNSSFGIFQKTFNFSCVIWHRLYRLLFWSNFFANWTRRTINSSICRKCWFLNHQQAFFRNI